MYPNVFIGLHITPDTLSVDCPNHDLLHVKEKVKYGSIRIVTACACTILLNGKTVGRSSGRLCEGNEVTTVDVLLPGMISLCILNVFRQTNYR